MKQLTKIQDTGAKPLRGKQEEYWELNIKPKYEKIRPGFKFKMLSQETLLKMYGIRAFEYGHWTEQNERLDFLTSAEASLADLKTLLQFKSIGFDKIGIAFGARGNGGFAAAHFEASTFMINLTRTKGMGCLAHEYGHAIDYYFGGYVDQSKESFALSGGQSVDTNPEQGKPGTLRQLMYDVIQTAIWSAKGVYSDSYKSWKQKHAGTDYWFRRNEIFARVFEQYVQIKLAEKKVSNHLLTWHKYDINTYLGSADIKRVHPKMVKLINEMARISK